MAVRIYSTLTGREEELVPNQPDGVLRMYVCGMTPKFHPHVGHARLFVSMDVIRRYLEYRGYPLRHIQNFTDIDDKIIQRAKDEGGEALATAKKYSDSYFESMDRLGVRRAHEFPTVSGYMDRIIEFTKALIETGHAYQADGDVWYSVASFPEYGKLSHRDLNSQLVAARKELEPGKRDPRDFALWKAAKPDEPSWPSPWGEGRPGWHIECSAMARATLGDTLDIHGGGSDLIFPHHENEIAQSEALTGKPFARHWVHAGVLTIGGEKMAHSLGNFLTIRDMLERYESAAIRLYLVGSHYRQPMTFVVDEGPNGEPVARGIEDAVVSLGRIRRALGTEPLDLDGALEDAAVQAFGEAMDADFNTPEALAAIFDLVREVNRRRDSGGDQESLDRARRTVVRLASVLGVDVLASPKSQDGADVGPFVELLLEVRRKLREAKQWQLSDEVRDGLLSLGIVVEDKPGGASTWRRADTP